MTSSTREKHSPSKRRKRLKKMYDTGRGKSLEVNAKLSGLPVVISLFTKDGK